MGGAHSGRAWGGGLPVPGVQDPGWGHGSKGRGPAGSRGRHRATWTIVCPSTQERFDGIKQPQKVFKQPCSKSGRGGNVLSGCSRPSGLSGARPAGDQGASAGGLDTRPSAGGTMSTGVRLSLSGLQGSWIQDNVRRPTRREALTAQRRKEREAPFTVDREARAPP